MSVFLDKFVTYLKSINAVAAAEPNPHRQAILRNYCHHAAYEFSNQDHNILNSEMTTANPLYNIKRFGSDMVTYRGLDDVQGYYTAVNREVIMLNDEQLMANDWGISSYSTFVRFVPGAQLVEEGHDDIDTDAIYVQTSPLAMFWPYDADAKLLGEDVYELNKPVTRKAAPEEVVTLEMRIEATRPFLP